MVAPNNLNGRPPTNVVPLNRARDRQHASKAPYPERGGRVTPLVKDYPEVTEIGERGLDHW